MLKSPSSFNSCPTENNVCGLVNLNVILPKRTPNIDQTAHTAHIKSTFSSFVYKKPVGHRKRHVARQINTMVPLINGKIFAARE